MHERALGLLGIARKGGNVQIGEEPVGQAARSGTARLIILASDAADHTVRRANSFAKYHDTPLVTIRADKAALGQVLGRSSVAMVAMTDVLLAKRFLETLGEPENYGQVLEKVTKKAEIMQQRKQDKPRRKKDKR